MLSPSFLSIRDFPCFSFPPRRTLLVSTFFFNALIRCRVLPSKTTLLFLLSSYKFLPPTLPRVHSPTPRLRHSLPYVNQTPPAVIFLFILSGFFQIAVSVFSWRWGNSPLFSNYIFLIDWLGRTVCPTFAPVLSSSLSSFSLLLFERYGDERPFLPLP